MGGGHGLPPSRCLRARPGLQVAADPRQIVDHPHLSAKLAGVKRDPVSGRVQLQTSESQAYRSLRDLERRTPCGGDSSERDCPHLVIPSRYEEEAAIGGPLNVTERA